MSKKFFWGAATSSFQVEGHIDLNDFLYWEKEGKFKIGNDIVKYDNGANHWLKWKEDLDYLINLGLNAYRFSIEWSRIQPKQNLFRIEPLEQYSKMIDHLIEHDIEPFVTLHHFTHPLWFHQNTPWHQEESVDVFCRFVEKVIEKFHTKVKYWITFNEPVVWALAAYWNAKFPPGYTDLNLTMKVIYNILSAHVKAYDIIKSFRSDAQVGIAKHFTVLKQSRKWFFLDKKIRDLLHYFFNQMILDAFVTNRLYTNFPGLIKFDSPIKINNKIDFWGINYYHRFFTKFQFNLKNPFLIYTKTPETDMGWEIYPKGLLKTIELVSKYGKKMIITENGIATNDEEKAKYFIKKHIKILYKAKKRNFDIQGYFYWSLLDNYEWLYGKSKRFGLIYIDYENNFSRKIKERAYYYSELIKKYSHKYKTLEYNKEAGKANA